MAIKFFVDNWHENLLVCDVFLFVVNLVCVCDVNVKVQTPLLYDSDNVIDGAAQNNQLVSPIRTGLPWSLFISE